MASDKNLTAYGKITDGKAVKKATQKFFLSADEALKKAGYPIFSKQKDEETGFYRWVWTSKDGQAKVYFVGSEERVPFIFDGYLNCQKLPPFKTERTTGKPCFTLILQDWMGEVDWLLYQDLLWQTLCFIRAEL